MVSAHVFYLSFITPRCGEALVQQKTRDWLAIAGFLESILDWLEGSSHDASAAMLPNGHLSLGALAAQTINKRSRHLLTGEINMMK
jgi:hypothetical protein